MTDFLRQALRDMWASAAPAWREHAEIVDQCGAPVTAAMLALAAARPCRVLELACGAGGAGLAAAERVDPPGEVVLSDVAAEMTAIAAERAAERALHHVRTAQIDMLDIEFPDASFDVVLCRDGLQMVVDRLVSLRESRRVLVPGGRAVFATWGPASDNPWVNILLDVITSQLGVPSPPSGMPEPFPFSCCDEFGELMAAAGFHEISVVEVGTCWALSSFEEWWSVLPSLAGPVGPLLACQTPETIAAMKLQAQTQVDRYRTGVDEFVLPGLSYVGSGVR